MLTGYLALVVAAVGLSLAGLLIPAVVLAVIAGAIAFRRELRRVHQRRPRFRVTPARTVQTSHRPGVVLDEA